MEFRAAVFPHGLAERSEAKDDAPLRLLPHALRMASLQAPHLWFGYIVLAPATTLHPFHDKSFGDIHKNMIAHSSPRGVRLLAGTGYAWLGCEKEFQAFFWSDDEYVMNLSN